MFLSTLCFQVLFTCPPLPLVEWLQLCGILSTSGMGNLGQFVLIGRLRPQELCPQMTRPSSVHVSSKLPVGELLLFLLPCLGQEQSRWHLPTASGGVGV